MITGIQCPESRALDRPAMCETRLHHQHLSGSMVPNGEALWHSNAKMWSPRSQGLWLQDGAIGGKPVHLSQSTVTTENPSRREDGLGGRASLVLASQNRTAQKTALKTAVNWTENWSKTMSFSEICSHYHDLGQCVLAHLPVNPKFPHNINGVTYFILLYYTSLLCSFPYQQEAPGGQQFCTSGFGISILQANECCMFQKVRD